MKFGLALPNFGKYADPRTILDFAKTAEEHGFDSLWVSEHIVIPESHNVFGKVFYEPLATLAYITRRTHRIKLGTSVLVLPYRNPVVLAKSLATLDVLTNGRLVIGIGTGWLEEEFRALSADFANRGRLTDEYLSVIKELFTSSNPRFHGEFFSFSGIRFSPKPLQKPHPPIWIGGNSRKALERTIKHGSGWHSVGLTPAQIKDSIKFFYDKTGEKPEISVRINLQITNSDIKDYTEILRGSPVKIADGINEYRNAGVDHIIFQVLSGTTEGIFDTMSSFSKDILSRF